MEKGEVPAYDAGEDSEQEQQRNWAGHEVESGGGRSPCCDEDCGAYGDAAAAGEGGVERAAQGLEVPGLASGQVEVWTGSAYDGRPLGDTRARTRTGASIVAVVRGEEVIASRHSPQQTPARCSSPVSST